MQAKDNAYYYCYTKTQLRQSGRILGKRRDRGSSPEKRREEITTKRFRGEVLTLEEKRSEEAEAVKTVLKQY